MKKMNLCIALAFLSIAGVASPVVASTGDHYRPDLHQQYQDDQLDVVASSPELVFEYTTIYDHSLRDQALILPKESARWDYQFRHRLFGPTTYIAIGPGTIQQYRGRPNLYRSGNRHQ